jgi:hypothetical protein
LNEFYISGVKPLFEFKDMLDKKVGLDEVMEIWKNEMYIESFICDVTD